MFAALPRPAAGFTTMHPFIANNHMGNKNAWVSQAFLTQSPRSHKPNEQQPLVHEIHAAELIVKRAAFWLVAGLT
jgi:hypothetical protein